MSDEPRPGAGHVRPVPARSPATGVDAQILANWQALKANPDADAGHVMQAIDRLLDQRARPAVGPVPAGALLAAIRGCRATEVCRSR